MPVLTLPLFFSQTIKKRRRIQMMSERFNPDPSDLRHSTIQKLFYNQIRNLTASSSVDDRMRTFDMQFSDTWF